MQKSVGQGRKVLYISGEESLKQIKIRADRIGQFNDNIRLFCETDLELIEQTLRDEKPDVAVIDSIQTIYNSDVSSAPGSVSQVRESTNILMQTGKDGEYIHLCGRSCDKRRCGGQVRECWKQQHCP